MSQPISDVFVPRASTSTAHATSPDGIAATDRLGCALWLTRGHPAAAERLHAIEPWRISVVTYIELAQGCRDKAELARLKKGLATRHTEVLPLTPAISQRAADLIDTLALSHNLRLSDALIGATALDHGLMLLTANTKHFSAAEGLQLEAFSP